ncbi:hypothetical protein OV079_23800 [Nannocystis pusilla]|uniref:DUF2190 family protein n=1 Tax=Nannocystis pusilla TaxID=889268 RepID=A0A9X3EQZ3_9BACT|nr:hypothetical protein [Nannocystis pusilla]MCY1004002.1 hypothetical protein [Nannocystis pusilla]MCY1008527.1 hypothetical protein [Nannocystis pusilla]
MTALTNDRDTKMIIEPALLREFDVDDDTLIYSGSIVAIDTADSNKAKPGATSTTLIVVGRAEHRANNKTGVDDPVKKIKVKAGTFLYANSGASDEITDADIGKNVYLVDDQTVAKTSATNTRSVAGKVWKVESAGVWVTLGLN